MRKDKETGETGEQVSTATPEASAEQPTQAAAVLTREELHELVALIVDARILQLELKLDRVLDELAQKIVAQIHQDQASQISEAMAGLETVVQSIVQASDDQLANALDSMRAEQPTRPNLVHARPPATAQAPRRQGGGRVVQAQPPAGARATRPPSSGDRHVVQAQPPAGARATRPPSSGDRHVVQAQPPGGARAPQASTPRTTPFPHPVPREDDPGAVFRDFEQLFQRAKKMLEPYAPAIRSVVEGELTEMERKVAQAKGLLGR